MVNQPVLGKKLIQEWAKAKSIGPVDAFRYVQKVKKAGYSSVSQADVAVAWTELLKLYPKFDQGLQAAIKKANSAQTDLGAEAALDEVQRICTDYQAIVAKWRAKSPARAVVADLINAPLQAIWVECGKAHQVLNKPRTRT